MEIELPDGTVLEAPDDADTRAVVRGYNIAKLKRANPGEYDSNSQEFQDKYGPLSKGRTRKVPIRGQGMVEVPEDDSFTEGLGSGMVRMTRGLGNLENKALNAHPLVKLFGGIDLPRKDFYGDEAVKEQDVQDRPLGKTVKGMLGQATGQAAVAAPVTAPLGALGGLSTGGRVLARTLAHPTTRAALEGAVTGAAAADPDEQGSGAMKGALASSVIERFLAGGGRLLRGLVQKSAAAEELSALAAQHGEEIDVPISQAAGDQDWVTRLAKSSYQEGLPLIPGVKGRLTRQSDDALAKVRELALREAAPDGTVFPPNAGKNVGEAVHSIEDSLAQEYAETVGSLDFHVPQNMPSRLEASIRKAMPDADETTIANGMKSALRLMKRFSSGQKTIEGTNLLNVRNELAKLGAKAPDYERGAYEAASSVIEDMINQRLSVQGMARRYADIAEPERQFAGLAKAAEAARNKGGNFSMDQLSQHATDPTQRYLAATAGEVFREPAAKSSMTGRILTGLGIGGYGAFIDPATAAGTFIGGNVLATKTVQKALMGDLNSQRKIAQLLIDHPEMAEQIQRIVRTAAAGQAGETDGGP